MRCSFVGCKSRTTNTNHKEVNLQFYKYPKSELLRKLWIDLSQQGDDFNVKYARVCGQHFTADNLCMPTLNLPQKRSANKLHAHEALIILNTTASKSKTLVASENDVDTPLSFGNSSDCPFSNPLISESNIKVCPPEDLDLHKDSVDVKRVCRFCLTNSNDTVRIAWDDWECSELTSLYEQITNAKLQISAQCSELYCNSCWQRLHDTFKSIQLFREANEFWKRHLQIQEENKQYGIDTTPIEDTKIEPLNNDVETACTVESSNHILEDVIFMIEPVTVVDGITKPEPPEATKMDFMAAEIDQDTSKPSKEPSNLKQEFPCGECDKVYKTAGGLTEHRYAVHESIAAFCKSCNRQFATVHSFQRHMTFKHGHKSEVFECDVCRKIMQTKSALKMHQLVHTRSIETLSSCDQCDKVCADSYQLRLHKKRIHGPHVPSTCIECGKVFRNRTRLLAHMLLHVTAKLQCDHCKKLFKSKKYIREHMSIVHRQGVPHICEKCGREFLSRPLGRKHSLKCSGKFVVSRTTKLNATNKCLLCPRVFMNLRTLQNHYMQKHDTKQREAVCMQCNQMLDTPQALDDHNEKVHENNLRCTICKKNCPSEAILRTHMDGHVNGKPRYECEICGGSYARFEYLKMHHRRRHTTERPFKCVVPDCGLAFAENVDLLNHQRCRHVPKSQRPHECLVCGSRYTNGTRLRRHMAGHTGSTQKCDNE